MCCGIWRLRMTKTMSRCVYCGIEVASSSREHVPPKVLLEEPFPLNLRTVPSCIGCNNSWQLDEEYLAVFLAHISDHPSLQDRVLEGGRVDRALTNSPFFDDRVIAALEVTESGKVSMQPELRRIGRIAAKIAYGLFCLKYGLGKSPADFSTAWISGFDHQIPQRLVAAQWVAFAGRRKRWTTVQNSVFGFLFAKGSMVEDPSSYCFLNFYNTLFVAVGGPHLVGKPKGFRLRSKPW
jgi:hypothetical protein